MSTPSDPPNSTVADRSPATPAARLLGRVRRRLYVRTLLGRVTWAIVIGCLTGVVVLLAGRLTGELTVPQTRWALAIGPAAAALLTLLVTRPPARRAAASEVDRVADADDLFLTAVSCEESGEGQGLSPVVRRRADDRAEELASQPIVRPWERVRFGWIAAALAAMVAADLFTPVLDPFGVVAAAEASSQQKRVLERDAEETRQRKAELARREESQELSPEVEETLDDLLEDLPDLTPADKSKRDERLRAAQKDFGRLWDNVSDRLAEKMLSKDAAGRRFGGETDKKFDRWKKEMQAGKPDSLIDEFEELQDLMQQARNAETTQQKKEALAKAEQKLQDLKKFAEQELGSQELGAAIERALRQMEAARSEELGSEAMQAVSESTDLSKAETEAMAQAMRDMQSIREALETLQEMRKMEGRDGEGFDGSECEDCQTLSDYAEFYRNLMAGRDGQGTGGDGQGDGGEVEEADQVADGFVKEKTDTKLQKGRMLMSLKGKGEGTLNEDEQLEFQQAVRDVAQDASEAVEAENIPPGYRDGIKRYFRSLEGAEE